MSTSPALGIDFGTTKTVAAIYQDGLPQVMWSRNGKRAMPSRVVLTKENKILAGWDSENLAGAADNQPFTISAIKRALGKPGQANWSLWSASPQEIAALLLGRLKLEAEAGLQRPLGQAVIAIPAHFDINQRGAIQQAAEIAGFEVLRLLNEATAAAICYSQLQHHRDGKILVFDFGGGTLDVSVVEVDRGMVQVIGTAGDGALGGEDIDDLLMQWVEHQAQPDFSLVSLGHAQSMYLRRQVVTLKEALSQNQRAELQIPGFLKTAQGTFTALDLALTRSAFESLCRPLFVRIAPVIQHALDTSKTAPADLRAVLMIGGGSRIPKVREIVTQLLGPNTYQGLDSEISVALGAAIQAGVLHGQHKNFLLIDALAADFSVGMRSERSVIFRRGEPYPLSKKATFTTSQHSQQTVDVPIYEHPPGVALEGNRLGQVSLSGLPLAAKGVPQIEVTFNMDANGLLTVRARDTALNRATSATLLSPYRLDAAAVNDIQTRLKAAFQDTPRTPYAPFQKPLEVTGAQPLRDLDAEAVELVEHLERIRAHHPTLFLDSAIPTDAWLAALRTHSGLAQRLSSIRAELTQTLPTLLARHIQHLSADFLLTWATTVRLRLGREEPLAAIFASFEQPNRTWLETFHTMYQLSANPTETYRATFDYLPEMQDRWSLAFVLRHTWPRNGLEKTHLPGLIENRAVSKDQAIALCLRELADAHLPERHEEAAHTLGNLLTPPEITALLLQFSADPNFQRSLSASLHAHLHKTPLPALAENYLTLSENGQSLWRAQPSLRALLRKALIRRLKNSPGEEAVRAALKTMVE